MFKIGIYATLVSLIGFAANAAAVSFLPEDLDSIPSESVGGVTVTASTTDGVLSTFPDGAFEGLYVAGSDLSGTYELSFSKEITSIDIYVQGLSWAEIESSYFSEFMSGFATEDGSVSVSVTNTANLWGTDVGDVSFDGTTIAPDQSGGFVDAEFKISYTGSAFTSFFFDHSQEDGRLGGVVIKQIDITPVPIPAAGFLLLGALGGLAALRGSARSEFRRSRHD